MVLTIAVRLGRQAALRALGPNLSPAARALATNAQPHPSAEEAPTATAPATSGGKEVILKYLDGKDNGIAVLGLNRPEARNAFGRSLLRQLDEALASVRHDRKVRVLVLRSLVPQIFSAGADLRERNTMDRCEAECFVDSLRDVMTRLESLAAPVIAALDGAALGGGLELALASDIRTVAAEAKLGLVETRLAIIPGAGGTQRLPRLIGPAKARELIYTARVLDGREAHAIGLANRVVPQNKEGDAAYQEALDIAREILPNGPVGVRLAKVAITKGMDGTMEDGMQVEKQCYAQLLDTKDRIEGLAAFVAKRAPVYQGL